MITIDVGQHTLHYLLVSFNHCQIISTVFIVIIILLGSESGIGWEYYPST